MKVNRVLGFDVGKTFGWAIYGETELPTNDFDKFVSLLDFYERIDELIEGAYVDAIISCAPRGWNNQTIPVFQAKLNGIIELICQKRGIYYAEIPDNKMRKEIMGKGNAKKEEVMEFTGLDNDHAADAMVAAMYGYKMLEKVL